MDFLVNFFSGRVLGPIWNFLDGKKTALASGASMLAGVAGLAAEVVPLVSAHNTAGLLELLKHLPSDPSYLMVVGGLGALGLGHKVSKVESAITSVIGQSSS